MIFLNTTWISFSDRGIDISSVEVIKDGKTFFWSGRYHNDMNSRDTLVTELNVLENFQPIVPESYKDAKILVLGNLHPAVQSSVLDQMKRVFYTLVILDTMNFWMDHALWTQLLEVIKRVDVITINDEEARQLTGLNTRWSSGRQENPRNGSRVCGDLKRESTVLYCLTMESYVFSAGIAVRVCF